MANAALNNGQRIRYETFGMGEPLILVHGLTNYGLSWMPQITPLVYNGFKVILPDLPGHGLSTAVEKPYTVDQISHDMFELLDLLEIDKITAIGLSLGGMVVQKMALQQPHRLKSIVVANSTPYFTDKTHLHAVQQWNQMFQQENGPQLRLEKTWKKLVHKNLWESDFGHFLYNQWYNVLRYTDGNSFINITKGMLEFDVRFCLDKIKLKTLIIASTEDEVFPLALSEMLFKKIPNSELHVIGESGHLSNLDNPQTFSSLLTSFLLKEGYPNHY